MTTIIIIIHIVYIYICVWYACVYLYIRYTIEYVLILFTLCCHILDELCVIINLLLLLLSSSSWDVTKQEVSILFRLFGSFHSSTYISPDVWMSDSRLKQVFCKRWLEASCDSSACFI